MRLVQVTVPTGKREAVLDALEDEGVDYVVTDENSGRKYAAVVYFPLPAKAVEDVLERLREEGLEDEAYTVVLEAQTVVSRRFDQLEEEYAERAGSEERIAREELRTTAADLAPSVSTYVLMTVVSAVIATAGLLLDSPAVVVGSMVIAPLIGPAMAASVGTVIDDPEMFARGAKLQILGFALSIGSAALFGAFVRYTHLVPPGLEVTSIGEVSERLTPDFLSLAVALGAGVAGAVSLSSGVSASLVGVMIAVALVPPAASVGIGIAWQRPTVVLGSGVLGLVNALSINLAAIAVFWYKGYRPEHWFRLNEARTATIKRVAVLLVSIAVLSVFLGGVTYDSYQNARQEETVKEAVADAVGDQATILETEVTFSEGVLFRHPTRAVVTVGIPAGTQPPALADEVQAGVGRALDRRVQVEVRYVFVTESDGRTEPGSRSWLPFASRLGSQGGPGQPGQPGRPGPAPAPRSGARPV